MKHGQGTYIWSDKSSYKGEWKENQIDGFGIYVHQDGRKYEGAW